MSARFEILTTDMTGLYCLTRRPIGDERGFLERLFCVSELGGILGHRSVRQINRTLTMACGTVRGMHFQRAPHAEMKFVTCLRGEVFDVAVDMRPESPTYLRWHAEILSGGNHKTLVIPEGFAHGFQTLSHDCEMFYCHTADYHPEAENGLHPLDPRLAIPWPLVVAEMSARDAGFPFLAVQPNACP